MRESPPWLNPEAIHLQITEKGPAVSDGPLVASNINRGTNETTFADRKSEVNISLDGLAFIRTHTSIFAPDGGAVRSLAGLSQYKGNEERALLRPSAKPLVSVSNSGLCCRSAGRIASACLLFDADGGGVR
jgi:hypothetical protein